MNPDPQISSARMRQARREDLVTGLEGLEKQVRRPRRLFLRLVFFSSSVSLSHAFFGRFMR